MVIILPTLYEYTACLDNLGNGIISVLENSLWCIKCTFTMHYAMTTMFVACVCLAFTSLWVYCMLGYSGKWHHYSVENSLWCIECRFTMQWQQYLLPVSYSLFKTLPKNINISDSQRLTPVRIFWHTSEYLWLTIVRLTKRTAHNNISTYIKHMRVEGLLNLRFSG